MSENYIIPCGKATLEVTFDRGDSEFLGDYWAEVSQSLLVEYMGKYPADSDLADMLDTARKVVTITNADSLIRFLYWLSQRDCKVKLEIEGTNPYWFCHDVMHALKDTVEGENFPDIEVSDYNEERTLLEGASLAHKVGVPLADIVRALVSAEKAFQERWGYEYSALEPFLNRIDKR